MFGGQTSWIIVEGFALLLFFICVNHIIKQENSFLKFLELFGFMLGAALFENLGVIVGQIYYYDVRRILMVGVVPLEILIIEAVIWYASFNLVKKLNVPIWAIPFIVGLFGAVQDMTVDPAAVFDRIAVSESVAQTINLSHPGALGDSVLSGQWNWTYPGYDGGFFGIPFYNFSGWMYLMAYYTFWVMIGRWLYEKTRIKPIGYSYPFIAGVLNVICIGTPINFILLYGTPDSSQSTYTSELLMLCINYAFALGLLFAFRKRLTHINLQKDGLIIFGLPIIIHTFDIVYAFAMGTTIAYVPVVVVSLLHFAYLYLIFRQSQALNETSPSVTTGTLTTVHS